MLVVSRNTNRNARSIARVLGGSLSRRGIWPASFFLYYPELASEPAEYTELRRFVAATKPQQRAVLFDHKLPVPMFSTIPGKWLGIGEIRQNGTKFVVRPLRHSRGEHYRVTDDYTDFVQGKEYLSEAWPKTHEYRLIYARGQFVVALTKLPPEGAKSEDAWNLSEGARFVQVKRPRCGEAAIARIGATWPISKLSLAGVDVMTKGDQWVVLEVNTCPKLGPFNLARVAKVVGDA